MTETLHLPVVSGSHLTREGSQNRVEWFLFWDFSLNINTNVTVDPPVNSLFEQERDSSIQVNSEKWCSAYKQSFIGPSSRTAMQPMEFW